MVEAWSRGSAGFRCERIPGLSSFKPLQNALAPISCAPHQRHSSGGPSVGHPRSPGLNAETYASLRVKTCLSGRGTAETTAFALPNCSRGIVGALVSPPGQVKVHCTSSCGLYFWNTVKMLAIWRTPPGLLNLNLFFFRILAYKNTKL